MINYSWMNKYIGLPYKLNGRDDAGVDCYGLAVKVFREQLGRALPDWSVEDGTAETAVRALRAHMAGAMLNGEAVELIRPADFSIVTVHRARLPHHMGLYVNGGVLHSDHNYGCTFQKLDWFKTIYPYKLRFWKWPA